MAGPHFQLDTPTQFKRQYISLVMYTVPEKLLMIQIANGTMVVNEFPKKNILSWIMIERSISLLVFPPTDFG